MEGFIVGRWAGKQWDESVMELAKWISEGKLKARETIVEGFQVSSSFACTVYKSTSLFCSLTLGNFREVLANSELILFNHVF